MSAEYAQTVLIVLALAAVAVGVLDLGFGAAWVLHDLVRDCERQWFSPKWSLLHVWFAFQVALLLVLICFVPIVFIVGSQPPVSAIVAMTVLQNVVFITVAAVVIFAIYRASAKAVGVAWLPTWRQLGIGIGLGLLLCGLGGVIETGSDYLLHAVLAPSQIKWLDEASKAVSLSNFLPKKEVLASTWTLLSVLFAVAFITPFGEEMMFRALLHRAARFRLGAFWGTALSAFVFALVHGGPIQLIVILPMGVGLAIAYDRSHSLWVPILMHMTNNTLSVIATYYHIPGIS